MSFWKLSLLKEHSFILGGWIFFLFWWSFWPRNKVNHLIYLYRYGLDGRTKKSSLTFVWWRFSGRLATHEDTLEVMMKWGMKPKTGNKNRGHTPTLLGMNSKKANHGKKILWTPQEKEDHHFSSTWFSGVFPSCWRWFQRFWWRFP